MNIWKKNYNKLQINIQKKKLHEKEEEEEMKRTEKKLKAQNCKIAFQPFSLFTPFSLKQMRNKKGTKEEKTRKTRTSCRISVLPNEGRSIVMLRWKDEHDEQHGKRPRE